jgi:hypothetical protein
MKEENGGSLEMDKDTIKLAPSIPAADFTRLGDL